MYTTFKVSYVLNCIALQHLTVSTLSSVRCPVSIASTAVVQVPTHYAAIFRGGTGAYLQVVQLAGFDYSQTSMSGAFLDSLSSAASEYHEVYDVPGELYSLPQPGRLLAKKDKDGDRGSILPVSNCAAVAYLA